jgi:hypothetical protein
MQYFICWWTETPGADTAAVRHRSSIRACRIGRRGKSQLFRSHWKLRHAISEQSGLTIWLGDPGLTIWLGDPVLCQTHPSIGDYFMLTTGQLVSNDDAFTGTVSVDNIVRQLITSGKSWKSYAESIPYGGYTGGDSYPYVKHHNPFSYLTPAFGLRLALVPLEMASKP